MELIEGSIIAPILNDPQGENGEKGDKGDEGVRGPQGPQFYHKGKVIWN